MDKVLFTSRLKLTLLQTLEEGTDDLKFVQTVRSSEEATKWSLLGVAKTAADAQKALRAMLPSDEGEWNQYRAAYAVHRPLEIDGEDRNGGQTGATEAAGDRTWQAIGLINLRPSQTVPLHEHITTKTDPTTGVLRLEIGYLFVPTAWGHGYATEACGAVLNACSTTSRPYFAPFTKLFVEGVVGPANPASMRVLEKAGLHQVALNEWDGPPVFLAGAWQEPCVWVYRSQVF